MAVGLGAFLDGVGDGYAVSKQMQREEARDEREKRRLVLEEQRAKEASEQFGLTKQLTEQQIAAGKRAGEEEERKLAMRNQVSADTQALIAWKNGQAPAPEWLPALMDGPTRKMGVGNEAPVALDPNEVTETQFRRLVNSIQQKALIDNKMLDADAIEKQVQFNKMIKNEGILEAFDHFEQNQDNAKALRIFQKNGKFTDVPKGTFLRTERDPETGISDIVVYTPGPGGKPQRYTSRSELLSAMMPENLVKYAQDMNKTRYEQTQANKRTASSNATSYGIAVLNNQGEMDRAKLAAMVKEGNVKDPKLEALLDVIGKPTVASIGNPANALDNQRFTDDYYLRLDTAYKLLSSGEAKSAPEAAAKAAQIIAQEKQKRGIK